MGQEINSVTQMVSYAGDLRRAAKQATAPHEADKLQQVATNLEKTALVKAGLTSPHIGVLLDLLA